MQTAARAPLRPLLFRYSQTEQNEGALAREDKPRAKTVPVNWREQVNLIKLAMITDPAC